MAEKVLAFDHGIIPQEKGWDCGPAATQVALAAVGITVTETQLISEIGTTTNGTDDVSWIENRCLDRRLPDANYTTVYLRSDPPTPGQVETYWRHLTQSVDTGHAVINNWVSPPSNPPRGVNGSQSPVGYGSIDIYHYVAAVGYKDNFDGRGGRAVAIADSGFRPFFYWVTLEQCVGLITPKGYCYANTGSPASPVPQPAPSLTSKERHALDILHEGQRRNITPRGIKIAFATGYVESNFVIYGNPKVPESMTNPLREAVGYDGMSVGIFQQQVMMGAKGWWWGDAATCMDPTLSAGLFFDRLGRLPYNDPNRTPGSFAQAVQSSAFPDRYDTRYADAEALYNRLVAIENDKENGVLQTSRSIYRTSNKRTMSGDDASFGADATSHMNWVETCAIRGHLWALLLVKDTANGGVGATKWWEVNDGIENPGIDPWAVEQAKSVLNYILAVNPTALSNAIGKAA